MRACNVFGWLIHVIAVAPKRGKRHIPTSLNPWLQKKMILLHVYYVEVLKACVEALPSVQNVTRVGWAGPHGWLGATACTGWAPTRPAIRGGEERHWRSCRRTITLGGGTPRTNPLPRGRGWRGRGAWGRRAPGSKCSARRSLLVDGWAMDDCLAMPLVYYMVHISSYYTMVAPQKLYKGGAVGKANGAA